VPEESIKEQGAGDKNDRSKKKIKAVVLVLALILIGLLAFSYFSKDNMNISIPQSFTADSMFAEFKLASAPFQAKIPAYSINYTELTNLLDFEKDQAAPFSAAQKAALNQDHFFVAPNLDSFYFYGVGPNEPTSRSDDWTYMYENIKGSSRIYEREPQDAVFITSDFLLHVYHRLLEKEFEFIEQTEFYPRLQAMTDSLFSQAVSGYNSAKVGSRDRESFERLIAFFAVPKAILDSAGSTTVELAPGYEDVNLADTGADTDANILNTLESLKSLMPESSYNLAKQELELVLAKNELKSSPIFGQLLTASGLSDLHDYTQYAPRSHYNKNSILRSYFKTMMWYGRSNFALSSSELTGDAVLITAMLAQGNQLENWEAIYAPTSFFVGKSDDLGVYEYSEVMTKLGSVDTNDAESISKVQQELKNYQGPQIMSSAVFGDEVFDLTKEELLQKTKGFRFMGQRFTPDAFIFSSLTQGDELPDPETGEKLPSSTTALMVMNILGSQKAKPLVDQWINQNAPASKNILAKRLSELEQSFSTLTDEDWTQNIYWGWLYTIKSLFTETLDLAGYPEFMKRAAWNTKSLQAALGSWTELKHDTLLYSKQSYAEMGAGGGEPEVPPVPKGYVEPNIQFLDRLIALSGMTRDGLMSRNLLGNEFQWRNEEFIRWLNFLREIAVKELQNEVISDDDFETLRVSPVIFFDRILGPLPNEEQIENNARSALIADVHTDTVNGQILYEATGIPNYIFVAVKDANGTRLTKGLVFSYFEFSGPLTERLTDEAWRELNYKLDKSGVPPSPAWSTTIVKQ